MANVQKENGYIQIANELYDAIIKRRLSSYEYSVLFFILRKTYGWNKKRDKIALSQFVLATGIKKSHISRTLGMLVSQNIITKGGNKSMREWNIQKDYDKWKKLPVGERSHHHQVTKGGNSELLPKGVTSVTKGGNLVVPKGGTTKDTITKERNTRRKPWASYDSFKVIKFTPKDVEVVELFIELIKKNFPAWVMRGNKDSWAEDINKLYRIDNYTYEQIIYMIKWVQKDGFWAKNILSAKKLREKFNDLVPKLKEIKSKSKHHEPNFIL